MRKVVAGLVAAMLLLLALPVVSPAGHGGGELLRGPRVQPSGHGGGELL